MCVDGYVSASVTLPLLRPGMLVVFEIPEKQARFYFESRPFFLKSGVCVCIPVESLVALSGTRYVRSDSGVCTGAQLTGS